MKKFTTVLLTILIALSLLQVTAFADNETGAATDPVPAEAAGSQDVEVPALPPVSVAVKGAGLCVSWQKADDTRSYMVYRSYKRTRGYKLVKKNIKGFSLTDKKVKSGKRAYYKVYARKTNGKKVMLSSPVSGIIYRVFIETGHGLGDDGRPDSGCTWNGYREDKLMIPICKSAANYLRARGVYVYTDAFSDNNRNLNVTIKKLKKLNASVFLNVHCDYRYAPSGTMPLYRYSNQKKLARCLNNGVHEYVQIPDRGLTKRTDLKTLNKTRRYCTACLFETGCIEKDNLLLRTEYDAYGKGLAKGVCDYLGIKW